MCGICGELRLDGQLPELKYLNSMMAKLEKRGPDHAGSFSDGGLMFGHRRLAIIDLSYKSNQPMVDIESSLALVFNGTIYNHPELRAELKARGHHFFSEGDTDLLLLYDQRQSGRGLDSRVTTSCVFYDFGLPVTGFHYLPLVKLILSQAERKVNENLMKAEQKDLIPDKRIHLIKKQLTTKN